MTIIEWREMVDAGLIVLDKDGNEIKEQQYNISMMKVKGYKVVEVTDTNINFDVCEDLYEMWTGMNLIGRVINISFWKSAITDLIEDMKDDEEYDSKDDWTIKVEKVLEEVNKLEEGLYIQFQELQYNNSMIKVLLEMLDATEKAWKNGHLTRKEAEYQAKEIDVLLDAYEMEKFYV